MGTNNTPGDDQYPASAKSKPHRCSPNDPLEVTDTLADGSQVHACAQCGAELVLEPDGTIVTATTADPALMSATLDDLRGLYNQAASAHRSPADENDPSRLSEGWIDVEDPDGHLLAQLHTSPSDAGSWLLVPLDDDLAADLAASDVPVEIPGISWRFDSRQAAVDWLQNQATPASPPPGWLLRRLIEGVVGIAVYLTAGALGGVFAADAGLSSDWERGMFTAGLALCWLMAIATVVRIWQRRQAGHDPAVDEVSPSRDEAVR